MTNYSSDDYIVYRLRRAKETILEVEKHIENKFWNTAVNRMYYACFYAVSALLYSEHVEISSHAGVRQKFGELYVKNDRFDRILAKLFTDLSEKRHKGDYNDFFDYDEATVLRLFPEAKRFVYEVLRLMGRS